MILSKVEKTEISAVMVEWRYLYSYAFVTRAVFGELCRFYTSQTVTSQTSEPEYYMANCPRPGDEIKMSACCLNVTSKAPLEDVCCEPLIAAEGLSAGGKAGIAVGIAFVLTACIVTFLFVYNKCTRCCVKHADEEAKPRTKIKLNGKKQNVSPIDKRTLLKTANYTVEKNWDEVLVKFHDLPFFKNFKPVLVCRYKELNWDKALTKTGTIRNSEGKKVSFKMIDSAKILIVTDEGNVTWVMNDFQNICKNVQIPDSQGRTPQSFQTSHQLLPRLPTVDEEHYTTDDYTVKITQTEVDVKFYSQKKFDIFKRAVLLKYPTIPWSKYSQRDCAQIKLEGGKRVTIHLWEEIGSVWLSGDGRIEWYNNEFEELLLKSTEKEFVDPFYYIPSTIDISKRSVSIATQGSTSSQSYKDMPTLYTVKTLDTGGFELEFPNDEFLKFLKVLLKEHYPRMRWKEYSCRHVAKIEIEKQKFVSIHISSEISKQRKLWIYDESNIDWINTIFREIYGVAYLHLYANTEDIIKNDENGLAVVETNM